MLKSFYYVLLLGKNDTDFFVVKMAIEIVEVGGSKTRLIAFT